MTSTSVEGPTLLVSDIFPPKTGGSARWFWEIYRRLPRADYLIAAGEDPRQAVFDEGHDLRVLRVPLNLRAWGVLDLDSLRGYARSLRPLLRIVAEQRVAMIHAARCLPEGLMAWALRHRAGVGYACYVHGEDVTSAATSHELRWLTRRVLCGAEFLIVNSQNTVRIVREEWRLPAERLRLLYPGVDTERFAPAARDPEARARLGWFDRSVILTVGRFQKRKGHDRMIEALGRIRQAIPNVLYAIIGDGEERAALHAQVARERQEGHVQFLGEVGDDRLIECYQQCDLFALPNRRVGVDIEGFGMVLLEAQACGRPVLAGDSGGTRETMAIPKTGVVVDCAASGPLADAIITLLSDRPGLERMGAEARRWVVERFGWKALAREAEHIFRSKRRPSADRRIGTAGRP